MPAERSQSRRVGYAEDTAFTEVVTSRPRARAVADPEISGTATRTLGRLSSALASSGTRVATTPSALRCWPRSGRITSKLVPMSPMRATTSCLAPWPMASITTTAPTPITMPSSVSRVRSQLARSERSAMVTASGISPGSGRPDSAGGARAVGVSAVARAGRWRVSATMLPSCSSMMRSAWAATSGSWVIRITVWPRSASPVRWAITASPLWLSRAPVGSSARITRPPFINARAMDTRCC